MHSVRLPRRSEQAIRTCLATPEGQESQGEQGRDQNGEQCSCTTHADGTTTNQRLNVGVAELFLLNAEQVSRSRLRQTTGRWLIRELHVLQRTRSLPSTLDLRERGAGIVHDARLPMLEIPQHQKPNANHAPPASPSTS